MTLLGRRRTAARNDTLATLTRWVLAHKRLVAGLWVLVTIAGFAATGPASDALSQEFTLPGREGYETNREIAATYGSGGDIAPIVPVVRLPEGTTVDTPGVTRELDARAREGAVRAAAGAHRLVRVDGRSGVRVRRRPHHVRARPHPAGARARAGPAGGGPGPAGARRRHRRRLAGRGDGPRRPARRLGVRRGRRHERERAPGGPARGRGRADRAGLRLRLVDGDRAAADGGGRGADHVPARLAAHRRSPTCRSSSSSWSRSSASASRSTTRCSW